MLDQLKKHYKQSLQGKVESIRAQLGELRGGNPEAEDRIRDIAHSLHGSGQTYGFPEISAAAKAVEHATHEDFLKVLTVLITVLQDTAGKKVTLCTVEREAEDTGPAILIVEDDKDISSMLKFVLGEKFPDYALEVRATAYEALKVLQLKKFALIILDLVLPYTDGREVLRQIRTKFKLNTPVFILSAMDNAMVRQECHDLGANHFFTKPFDPTRIADEMGAVFRGEDPAVAIARKKSGVNGKKSAGRLLVAEDDELLARIILHRLSREGLQVNHVDNGEAALDALTSDNFDMVILDVKMPVMDGFEVLERFRAMPGHEDVPVVMLTAMGSEKDIVRGYQLGATDYVLKPFSPVELIARVKSLLREAG